MPSPRASACEVDGIEAAFAKSRKPLARPGYCSELPQSFTPFNKTEMKRVNNNHQVSTDFTSSAKSVAMSKPTTALAVECVHESSSFGAIEIVKGDTLRELSGK